MRILAVDDDQKSLKLMEAMLAPQNYEVLTAFDGEAALAVLRAREVDLVLLDVMMPGRSGLEVLKEIRRDGKLGATPVVLITGLEDRKDRLAGLLAGADDYVSKPYDREELLARIATQVKLVTLRKRLVAELTRSNQDLERFALIAAHDLKAPLQNISGFAALLADDFAVKLGPEAEKHISIIQRSAERMRALIDALLAYSRFGLPGRPFGPVDCAEACDAAISNLAALIAAGEADVRRGPLPVISGDKDLLIQLFQNLIGNGVKYRGKEPPVVSVDAERKGGEWLISVKDNGIGIPPGQYERIFDMFTRLHNWDDYPGTGIGLAACRRIAGLHGGRIWAESEPGKGSVFYVALPAEGSFRATA
ncbi:MAG TPA: hybrid sensor histidine kinase/response regulator [Elusimicrobia bacterium]|nr:hybrid sensor histidine kinase/response regulator [Elusimicrobiota bacterium]